MLHSSGDNTMDQSVMTAAERVLQIDPLPAGLGNGESFEINIAFKLDQGQ
nr:energy transducer TonB [Chthoniobacter flavus]